MRKLLVLLFSLTAIGGLSGCVHHSVEYRGSPHIIPHDSIVIRSTPYYRSTHVTKTIIVPHERQLHPKHYRKDYYSKHQQYQKPRYKKYKKTPKPVSRSFLRNDVVKHAKKQQRQVTKKVVKKRIYKTQRQNVNGKQAFKKRHHETIKVKKIKRVRRAEQTARQRYAEPKYSNPKYAKPKKVQREKVVRNNPRIKNRQEKLDQKQARNRYNR